MENFRLGYGWQPCSSGSPFPHTAAIRAGRDADGCTIYVGRAFHEGDLLPAKVIPDKQLAYVCWGGEEHPKTEFEVLRSGDFVWEFAAGGEIPAGAIEIGHTADGEKLYCGRALHAGTQTPGKVIKKPSVCAWARLHTEIVQTQMATGQMQCTNSFLYCKYICACAVHCTYKKSQGIMVMVVE